MRRKNDESRLQRTLSCVLWSQMPLDTEVEAAEGHSGSIRPRPTLASPVESLGIPGGGWLRRPAQGNVCGPDPVVETLSN